jgi:hypothetical protein
MYLNKYSIIRIKVVIIVIIRSLFRNIKIIKIE